MVLLEVERFECSADNTVYVQLVMEVFAKTFRMRRAIRCALDLNPNQADFLELTANTGVYSCRVAVGVGIIKTRRNSLSSPRYLSFEPRSPLDEVLLAF